MWHWEVGIKRSTSAGIKIPTSHSFRVGWDATLIRVKDDVVTPGTGYARACKGPLSGPALDVSDI